MTIEPSKPETTPTCGCSFERWGRDSFKISVCDEHRCTAALFGEPENASARMVGERPDPA